MKRLKHKINVEIKNKKNVNKDIEASDFWEFLFNQAADDRNEEMNDLKPFWIFENE